MGEAIRIDRGRTHVSNELVAMVRDALPKVQTFAQFERSMHDLFNELGRQVLATNPTQARNAISYIVNNWRHHRCDRDARWRTDPYSSAHAIAEWRIDPHPERLPVVRPTTWLLTEGYKRAKAIHPDEVPGPDPIP